MKLSKNGKYRVRSKRKWFYRDDKTGLSFNGARDWLGKHYYGLQYTSTPNVEALLSRKFKPYIIAPMPRWTMATKGDFAVGSLWMFLGLMQMWLFTINIGRENVTYLPWFNFALGLGYVYATIILWLPRFLKGLRSAQ